MPDKDLIRSFEESLLDLGNEREISVQKKIPIQRTEEPKERSPEEEAADPFANFGSRSRPPAAAEEKSDEKPQEAPGTETPAESPTPESMFSSLDEENLQENISDLFSGGAAEEEFPDPAAPETEELLKPSDSPDSEADVFEDPVLPPDSEEPLPSDFSDEVPEASPEPSAEGEPLTPAPDDAAPDDAGSEVPAPETTDRAETEEAPEEGLLPELPAEIPAPPETSQDTPESQEAEDRQEQQDPAPEELSAPPAEEDSARPAPPDASPPDASPHDSAPHDSAPDVTGSEAPAPETTDRPETEEAPEEEALPEPPSETSPPPETSQDTEKPEDPAPEEPSAPRPTEETASTPAETAQDPAGSSPADPAPDGPPPITVPQVARTNSGAPAAPPERTPESDEFALPREVLEHEHEDSLDEIQSTASEEAEPSEEEFTLSEEDFERLKKNLKTLPMVLKLKIEETYSKEGFENKELKPLTKQLIEKADHAELVKILEQLTGRKIKLPRKSKVHTGEDYEQYQEGFIYQFNTVSWPFLKKIISRGLLVWAVFLIGVLLFYREVQSEIFYRKGIALIPRDQFEQSEAFFNRAVLGWSVKRFEFKGIPRKRRFLNYARAYEKRRALNRADQKYRELLTYYPENRTALLAYGQFLSERMGNYKKADEVINYIRDKRPDDRKALIALGENAFLRLQSDPEEYEKLQQYIASYISRYGFDPPVILLSLHYLLRNERQIDILKIRGLLRESWIKRYPLDLEKIYTILGGFYLSHGELANAGDVLKLGAGFNRDSPLNNYYMSDYLARVKDRTQEVPALRKTLNSFLKEKVHTPSSLYAHNRAGLKYGQILYEDGNETEALHLLATVEEYYEDVPQTNPDYPVKGVSAELGDLVYDQSVRVPKRMEKTYLKIARAYFDKAHREGFASPEINYKQSRIDYIFQDYDRAALKLYQTMDEERKNPNVFFSLGNIQLKRRKYSEAANAYRRSIRLLLKLEESTQEANIPVYHFILRQLERAYNNLGVAVYYLSFGGRKGGESSEAGQFFSLSNEYADRLSRNKETQERSPDPSPAFLNLAALFKNTPEDLKIYEDIPSALHQGLQKNRTPMKL